MDKASLLFTAGVIPLGAATIAFAGAGWWSAALCAGAAAGAVLLLSRRAAAERGMPHDHGANDQGL
ncbi:hypothetical protein QE430_002315 [Microbacterium testaceum]|nr:hypothetical protein [Microbacterium testaceum]